MRMAPLFGLFSCFVGGSASVLLAVFLSNIYVPLQIDGPVHLPIFPSILINMFLIALFGLQHSIMARPFFKDRFNRVFSKRIERSAYVLMAGLMLFLLLLFWQPIPISVWEVKKPFLQSGIWLLFAGGWVLSGLAMMAIDFFDLMGIRQSGLMAEKDNRFQKSWIHRHVRHPIYTGLIIAFWATPVMTLGHLLFALSMTIYIRIGIHYEEKGLIASFGEAYSNYRNHVPMLFPKFW